MTKEQEQYFQKRNKTIVQETEFMDSIEKEAGKKLFGRVLKDTPELAGKTPRNMGDAKERKQTPIATGVIDYFPDALAAVAQCSFAGNEQHNPGTPLHWDRSKSGDESDALIRHFLDRGTIDNDGIRHSAKVAWRALAVLQKEIESEEAK